jgi:hypothetical protein
MMPDWVGADGVALGLVVDGVEDVFAVVTLAVLATLLAIVLPLPMPPQSGRMSHEFDKPLKREPLQSEEESHVFQRSRSDTETSSHEA